MSSLSRLSYQPTLCIFCILAVFLLQQYIVNENGQFKFVTSQTHRRSRRSIYSRPRSSQISNADGISARVGEVEFFTLALADRDEEAHNDENQQKKKSTIELIRKLISLQQQNAHLNNNKVYVSSLSDELEVLDDTDEEKKSISETYPAELLQKIKDQEASEYYVNLINDANLKMEGRDLTWWGYNKTHEFLIDRKELDDLDVNALKITDNLEQRFGRPSSSALGENSSSDSQKSSTSSSKSQKLKFQPKQPLNEIASWEMPENIQIQPPKEKPSGVIVISPLSAEIKSIESTLNQHPQAFYQYEPLKIVGDGCSNQNNDQKISFLNEVLNCQFNDLSSKLTDLKKRDEKASRFVGKGGLVFRYKSHRLCQGQFCQDQDFSHSEEQCMSNCPDVDLYEAKKSCSNKTAIAKVIRICNVNTLEPILSQPGSTHRVVYVVRDPRAIAEARSKMFSSWSNDQILNSMKWTCMDQVRSLQAILINQPDWADKKFLAVRAEDFSTSPKTWVENVLNYSGLDSKDLEKEAEKFSKEAESIENWRTSKVLDYQLVKQIESVCGEMMQLSGYKKVSSEAELGQKSVRLF